MPDLETFATPYLEHRTYPACAVSPFSSLAFHFGLQSLTIDRLVTSLKTLTAKFLAYTSHRENQA